jgi:hypothetical protein
VAAPHLRHLVRPTATQGVVLTLPPLARARIFLVVLFGLLAQLGPGDVRFGRDGLLALGIEALAEASQRRVSLALSRGLRLAQLGRVGVLELAQLLFMFGEDALSGVEAG